MEISPGFSELKSYSTLAFNAITSGLVSLLYVAVSCPSLHKSAPRTVFSSRIRPFKISLKLEQGLNHATATTGMFVCFFFLPLLSKANRLVSENRALKEQEQKTHRAVPDTHLLSAGSNITCFHPELNPRRKAEMKPVLTGCFSDAGSTF